MAFTDELLKLFGWKSGSIPRDKVLKGDEPEEGQQYGSNPYELYANTVKPPYERRRKYDIYDEMDEMPDVNSILDAYAEDCTQFDNEKKRALWIEAKDETVRTELESLFDRLKIEEYIQAIARDVGKFGDDFALLDIEGDEIKSWDWRDPRDIERIENNQGLLQGFEKTDTLKQVISKLEKGEQPEYTYKPWDIVHFRNYKRKREWKQKFRNIYGTSLLAGSERIGKQVKIMDDMLMVRRLTKTLDTRVYKVDTGRSAVEQEVLILKRWRNALKRRPYIDPANQKFDSIFDPFTFQEDIFWPNHDGSQSTVDIIQGQANVGQIVDIEHFRDKFFGSMRAPKGYFGYDSEGAFSNGKTLAQQDMKWGRSCNMIQMAVRNGITRLCQIQLALKEIDPFSEFTVCMVVPSVLEQLSRLEAMTNLIDIAERMMSLGQTMQLDMKSWRTHVLKSVLGMTDADIDRFTSTTEDDPNLDQDTPDGTTNGPTQLQPLINKEMVTEFQEYLLAKLNESARFRTPERARPAELPPKRATSSPA